MTDGAGRRTLTNKLLWQVTFAFLFIAAASARGGYLLGGLRMHKAVDAWYGQQQHVIRGMAFEGDCRIVPPTGLTETDNYSNNKWTMVDGPCFIGGRDMTITRPAPADAGKPQGEPTSGTSGVLGGQGSLGIKTHITFLPPAAPKHKAAPAKAKELPYFVQGVQGDQTWICIIPLEFMHGYTVDELFMATHTCVKNATNDGTGSWQEIIGCDPKLYTNFAFIEKYECDEGDGQDGRGVWVPHKAAPTRESTWQNESAGCVISNCAQVKTPT